MGSDLVQRTEAPRGRPAVGSFGPGWRSAAARTWRRVQRGVPAVSVVGLLTLVLIAARHERALRYASLNESARAYRVQLARRVERMLEHRIRSLQVLALGLERFDSGHDREVATQSTAQVVTAIDTLRWFGKDGACKLAFRDGALIPNDTAETRPADWNAIWSAARTSVSRPHAPETADAFISRGFVENDASGKPDACVDVVIPLQAGSPGGGATAAGPPRSNAFDGIVVGKCSLGRLMQPITDDGDSHRYKVTMADAGLTLFDTLPAVADADQDAVAAAEEPIRVHNVVWQLRTAPTETTRAAARGNSAWIILGGGTLVSLLVAGGFAQARNYRRRELRQARSYAAAVERLHAVAAAIGTKLGSSQDVLGPLAAASAELIGVQKVRVSYLYTLPDGTPSLRCLASFGWPAGTDLDFPLAQLPNGQLALRSRLPVVINDASLAERISPKARQFNTMSLMLVPIIVEGRPIGMLSLCDGRKHVFTEDRQRLGRLWAAQAAVVMANTQLHLQAHQALEAQQRLMLQRERLSAITNKIYTEKTLAGTLERITQLSTSMLGVDHCAVLLRPTGGGEDDLVLTAASPGFSRFNIPVQITSRTGRVRQVYARRRVDIMTNVALDPHLDPYFKRLLGEVSVMAFPIYQSNQQPLGLLCWLRSFPGTFSPEQIELGEIFASRAAVALENARLHEQTLQDGQTKAMLLRELNHRVKNNLAGIVGLMQATEMTISEESRPAVARLAQRVRTIAKAHELFVGGAINISVSEMIEQVLSPVLAVSGGVGVKVFCHDVKAKLRTDRAVSMAMVLHELAFNAVFHGCDPDGHIEVHARIREHELVIEIIDSGVSATPADRPERSGMGLQLVQGLVRRELHGRFSLEQDPRGGSRAVVQVPLDSTEVVQAPVETVSPQEVNS